jgi:DNA-binding NarL/FixJ family response regulator
MRKTVLIVDENAFIRHALYELFQREADIEVCGVAENGQEAIDEAARLHPDLIVLDVSMPGMNGLETARVLKRRFPAVLVIMFGASADTFSEPLADMIGVPEFVSKSERVTVLIAKARGLLYPHAA